MSEPAGLVNDKITLPRLAEPDVILTLGAWAAKQLKERGVVCLFFSAEGDVEQAPLIEVQCDQLPEPDALALLSYRGYDDTLLATYLKGRDARGGKK